MKRKAIMEDEMEKVRLEGRFVPEFWGYSQVRSEASNDWLKLLSWLSGWLPEIGELLLVVAGFNERLSGASESFELLVLVVVEDV